MSQISANRIQESRVSRYRCLIVEDEKDFGTMLVSFLEVEGWLVHWCCDCSSAMQTLEKQSFDLVILDNHLPDGLGAQLYARVSNQLPDVPVIMITGEPDLRNAVQLTRHGLFDYLIKPLDVESLTECLTRVRRKLESQSGPPVQGGMFFKSAAMRRMHMEISRAAGFPNATVLLVGETGSGKDVAARELHRMTRELHPQHKELVSVNCAAVPSDIFESELFGSEKGAFTGADKKRNGLIAAADGGTLFLDEITEMPLDLQAKLLRFLESRVFRSLGSTVEQVFRGRIVAATNRDLDQEVRADRFREDLKFRIDVLTIALPPLRERRDEIPGLAQHLLAGLAETYGVATPILQAPDLDLLTHYSFPGNVRELRNILERALLMMDPISGRLQFDRRLFPDSRENPPQSPVVSKSGHDTPDTKARIPDPQPAPIVDHGRELTPIEAQEYELIRQAILDSNGGIRRAAAIVGLSPQSLLRRLSKWPELHELARQSGGR